MRVLGVVVLGAALVGCAAVQQQSISATPVGQPLVAGVGDVVLRMDGRESMPNVFGNADILGRTRPTGFATVQYGGMQGGKVVLLRSGVVTQSDATTMNSTPLIVPTQQTTSVYGTVGSNPVSATTTTSGVAYIPPVGSTSTSSQQSAANDSDFG
jgi:hypothetical protein